MTLQDFIDYYNTPMEKRATLYNVLSLEFSNTEMEDLVCSPELVRQIDWVENHWPDPLRQRYITFNKKGHYTAHHTYPKVQNYCLMSVERCYTDFHVDFGGTSVWYHVLKGQKVFWMIEPSLTNIRLYEEFVKNPEQTGFFGYVVEKCCRIVLNPGTTAIIPSGWIHAVYTPCDSLVFGGNFLHSLRADMQIQVHLSENRINITKKFRFPYMEELMLYVIADVVLRCTGRHYTRPARIDKARFDYVGKFWKQKGNHRKMINYQDYMSGGVQLQEKDLSAVDNQSEIQDNGVVNVIAMHAENTLLYNTAVSTSSPVTSQAADGNIEIEEENSGEQNGEQIGGEATNTTSAPHSSTDPTIFYHEASIFHDLYGRSTSAHRNAIENEPPIEFNQVELDRISPLLLPEYERLCEYLRKKRLLDVAEGITRPASLLNCFHCVLEQRRQQLVEMNLLPPKIIRDQKPKKTSRKNSLSSSNASHATKSPSSISKDSPSEETEAGVDHTHIGDETVIDDNTDGGGESEMKVEEDVACGTSTKTEEATETLEEKKRAQNDLEDESVSKPSTSQKHQADEDYEMDTKTSADVEDDDDEDYEEKPKRKSNKSEKKRLEKTEKKAKETKDKKTTKRRTSLSFEDALGGTPKGSKKKHDPKKDKPMFVGGLPVAAIQDGPVVPNAYNYDPMAEIMKLGTGQLQSAYRKSKLNISPPKDKKIYKLEPKHHGEESATNSDEKNTKPVQSRPSLSSTVPPRTGFMPRLHDIPPSTASAPSKSPAVSPAPRRQHAASAENAYRPPADFVSAASRSSRGSLGDVGTSGTAAEGSLLMRNGASFTPQQHSSPIVPSINSPKPSPKDISPSDAAQREDVLSSTVRSTTKLQEQRKARFADNPVSDISPPPVSTTPPFMPSPGPPLRSPDLPPTSSASTSSSSLSTQPNSSVSAKIPMKQALIQLSQIVKELNEVNAL
ncbi:hypothetical protein KIN20_035150 [Parelaphostrongylus tenuis]|uniref:JmjC domain-containing protein n=1 Tax=Parelaphostrongylus tenuis TaxID=148309 RepID=A0AAD5WKK4_PARTN|nr:hypothetical protein KIN20_035150 [Parelaphostrongylus tenuis]